MQGGLGLLTDPLASISILQAAPLRAHMHTWRAERHFHTWSWVLIRESRTAAPPTSPGQGT